MFTDWFNGVERAATSGMPPNTAMTSLDERGYKLWERTDLSSHTEQILRSLMLSNNTAGSEPGKAGLLDSALNNFLNMETHKVYDAYKDP